MKDLRNQALVSAQFTGEEQIEVNEMYKKWETFRDGKKTGSLDRAFASREPAELQDLPEGIAWY
jgi:hypothetical protein